MTGEGSVNGERGSKGNRQKKEYCEVTSRKGSESRKRREVLKGGKVGIRGGKAFCRGG